MSPPTRELGGVLPERAPGLRPRRGRSWVNRGRHGRPSGGRARVDGGLRGVVVADVRGELGSRRLEWAVALDHVDLARVDAVGVLHPEGGVVAAGVGHEEAGGHPNLGAGGEGPALVGADLGEVPDLELTQPVLRGPVGPEHVVPLLRPHPGGAVEPVVEHGLPARDGRRRGGGGRRGPVRAGSGVGSSAAMTAGPPPNPAGASATTSRRNATTTVPSARASRDITLLDMCAGRTGT